MDDTQAARAAAATRERLVSLGSAFMISPEILAEEERAGLPRRSLYFRGRAAVLGDLPPHAVHALYGVFPMRVIEYMIGGSAHLPAERAVEAYLESCWTWGRNHLSGAPGELAGLLFTVVDAADLTALPLVAAWQAATRPAAGDHPAALAQALMLARELRGALHFCALRACGLSITQALILDPNGTPARLRRTGWTPEEIDHLTSSAAANPPLADRWRQAEQFTDSAFGSALSVLGPGALSQLVALLEALTAG